MIQSLKIGVCSFLAIWGLGTAIKWSVTNVVQIEDKRAVERVVSRNLIPSPTPVTVQVPVPDPDVKAQLDTLTKEVESLK